MNHVIELNINSSKLRCLWRECISLQWILLSNICDGNYILCRMSSREAPSDEFNRGIIVSIALAGLPPVPPFQACRAIGPTRQGSATLARRISCEEHTLKMSFYGQSSITLMTCCDDMEAHLKWKKLDGVIFIQRQWLRQGPSLCGAGWKSWVYSFHTNWPQ